MRRLMMILISAAALLSTAGAAGCTGDLVATNARSSAAGFLTGVVSAAINDAIIAQ